MKSQNSIIREASDIIVTDPKTPVKLLLDANGDSPTSILPRTVVETFSRTVEIFPDQIAFVSRDEVTKELKTMTFQEYKHHVEKIAKVFIKLGLERHGLVAVFAFNCAEWFISELAAIHAGGIITGIYLTSSVEACLHILQSSRTQIVVVESDAQMQMILLIKHKLPYCRAVIQLHSLMSGKSSDYWLWSELGEVKTDDVEDEYRKRLRNMATNECCCLVYTSGTVGNPKGVMLSHDNLMFGARSLINRFNPEMGKEVLVSYLPLSHLAAQMADVFISLSIGATVYFADKDALKSSLLGTLIEAQPTLFFSVPRVYEKIHEKMVAVGSQAGLLQRLIGAWAKRVTFQHHMNQVNGNPTNSFQFKIAQRFILSKVRQALGFRRCKVFLSGAAPIAEATRNYFLSLDIPLTEAYGMTETSGVHSSACMSNLAHTKKLPGVETKIVNLNDDGHGEVCIRGRHVFMGYIYDPEKTVEVIDEERWMRTGDLGFIDKEGYLHITGRIKEIIITSGGENIPFVSIETSVRSECPAISNAFVVGDKRKFLILLITLKTEVNDDGSLRDELNQDTKNWLRTLDVKYTKLNEILSSGPDPKVLKALQGSIDRANDNASSNAQRIQKFAILPHDFTITTGELTPTMKVKRNFVLSKFEHLIEDLYAE